MALKRVDVRWFEDDGVVRFRKVGSSQVDAPSLTLTPDTGLVGTAQETEEGVEAVMFLNPQVQRGSVISLESETLTGLYHVVAMRHEAENWQSNSFTTWVDLRTLA